MPESIDPMLRIEVKDWSTFFHVCLKTYSHAYIPVHSNVIPVEEMGGRIHHKKCIIKLGLNC